LSAASETVVPSATEQIARFPKSRSFGLSLNIPVWNTMNLATLALMTAAMVAIFRFKAGMITVLFASCFAGIAFHLFNIPGS